MRQIVCWVALGVVAASGWAQGVSSGDARQDEVRRLGEAIYGIRLNQGKWTHAPVPVCPAFNHHAFVRFERQDAREAFLAIYNLDVPPAKSKDKPWQGGIVLLPLYGLHHGEQEKPVASSDAAMSDFNKIWLDERRHGASPDVFPAMSWVGVAECYARLVGEQPVLDRTELQNLSPPQAFDLSQLKVESVLVPLSPPDQTRALFVKFDGNGLVTEAAVSVTAASH